MLFTTDYTCILISGFLCYISLLLSPIANILQVTGELSNIFYSIQKICMCDAILISNISMLNYCFLFFSPCPVKYRTNQVLMTILLTSLHFCFNCANCDVSNYFVFPFVMTKEDRASTIFAEHRVRLFFITFKQTL